MTNDPIKLIKHSASLIESDAIRESILANVQILEYHLATLHDLFNEKQLSEAKSKINELVLKVAELSAIIEAKEVKEKSFLSVDGRGRICENCGVQYIHGHTKQRFCTQNCRYESHARDKRLLIKA